MSTQAPYHFLFLIFFGIFNLTPAQIMTTPSVTIKDHNDNKSSVTIDCNYKFNENHKILLKAEYPELRNTSSYTVTSIPYNPFGNFSDGEEITIDSDDKWSNVQNLPFKFCFFGNIYNSIILGDNGVISFDTQYAGTECPYAIAGSLPSPNLMHNTIFGAYHDMTNDGDVFGCTSDCGKITMYTTGLMPFRKTIINYYNMNHFGCEYSKSTLQIILYETTNVIEIYIKDKPLTCDIGNEKRALIGISNSDGSKGISPEKRNTGIWEAHNEAWRFSPQGTVTIPNVEWRDSNQTILSSSEISPKESTTYYVNVSYAGCTPVTLNDKFQIIFSPDYPKVKDLIVNKCYEEANPNEIIDLEELMKEASETNPDIITTLHLNMEDANSGLNPISNLNSYPITSNSKSFYLRASKGKECYSTSVITVHLKRKPRLKEMEPIIICSNNTNDSEIIYLNNYNDQIKGYEEWMTLDYFDSYTNALNSTNPINTLSLSSTVTVYAKASNKEFNDCFSIIPVTFKFQKTIVSRPQEIILCNKNLNGQEIYNLRLYETSIKGYEKLSFNYYNSKSDALQNINPILNPDSYSVKNEEIIYVVISSPGYCSSINTLSFTFKNTLVQNMHKYVCDDKSHEINVNLLDYYNEMKSGHDIVLDGIYYSWQAAMDKDQSQIISNLRNYTVKSPFSIVYVRFYDNRIQCEYIREIKLEIRDKIEKGPTYNVCDLNNSGESNFNLNTLRPIFLAGYPPSSITFYETLEDYNNETNPVTETIIKGHKFIYVKIKVDDGCKFFHKIDLILKSLELSELQNISLCDKNNDGIENYNLNDLIGYLNLSDYNSVKFYKSENDAFKETNPINNINQYPISITHDNKVYVRTDYEKSCPGIVPVEINLLESVMVSDLNPIEICDIDNSHNKTVNLISAIDESGIDSTQVSMEFYLTQKGAQNQNNNEKISDPTSFSLYNTTTVFVRFTNIKTKCYEVKPLKLKLNPFPQVMKSNLEICDFNNDQQEEIILSDLNSHLVSNYQSFTFSYYYTEKDALNNINNLIKHTIKSSTELYVKISSGNECQVIQKLEFTLKSSPLVHNKTVEICDNNADDTEIVNLTLYEDFLIDDSKSNYNYSYFTSFENAYNNKLMIYNTKEYVIQKFPSTIFVRISNSFGCFSIAELTFNSAEKILAQNKKIHICDEGSDMQEYVNLTKYISEILLTSEQNLIINYYKTEKGANNKDVQTLIKNPDRYSVTLAKDYVWIRMDNPTTGCYTVRYLEINLEPLPKLINAKYLVCDKDFDGIYKIDLDELRYTVIFNPEGYTFSYYHTLEDATKDINKIENIHSYTVNSFNEKIVLKATNNYGCSSIRTVTLYTKDKIKVNSNSIEIESCDDDFDGLTLFNITTKNSSITNDPKATFEYFSNLTDAQNQTHPILDPYNYKNVVPYYDKVYIRVSSPDYCPSLSILNLKVLPVPVSILQKDLKICPNGTLKLFADTKNPKDFYEWSTGEKGYNKHTITISKAGIYTVTITNTKGCKYTYTTNVTEYPKTKITDLREGNDYITVIAEGDAPLEYSIDNKNWQSNNTFYNLKPGIYTFYVRSLANGCFSPERKGVLFKINNVITPNGDNFNDAWRLCGLEHFDSLPSHIKIFDRYGKVVFSQSSNTCFVWNGYYLGRPLPTTSYWYVIDIADGRQFTGWIALRNHNNQVD